MICLDAWSRGIIFSRTVFATVLSSSCLGTAVLSCHARFAERAPPASVRFVGVIRYVWHSSQRLDGENKLPCGIRCLRKVSRGAIHTSCIVVVAVLACRAYFTSLDTIAVKSGTAIAAF